MSSRVSTFPGKFPFESPDDYPDEVAGEFPDDFPEEFSGDFPREFLICEFPGVFLCMFSVEFF